MKRTPVSRRRRATDEPRAEYEFDYRTARQNRFAGKVGAPTVAVVLEPDVAQVFDSSKSVNRLLRSVIKAVPKAVTGLRRSRKAG